ncbi:MAG: hypothetical protein DRN27_09885 [Thermoplasmata archaeon]|nr:MAG: hypothetical protein DRN27_09885 [Thermoplasmata archaeon]
MYRIEKRFTVPIGHRLSKNKGRCFSIHGHNFTILVGLKSEKLNKDDMIIDFSDLKSIVGSLLDQYDHTLLVNKIDEQWLKPLADKMCLRSMIFDNEDHDPTAERLSQQLFFKLDKIFSDMKIKFKLEYVTVYENENSKAVYSRE